MIISNLSIEDINILFKVYYFIDFNRMTLFLLFHTFSRM